MLEGHITENPSLFLAFKPRQVVLSQRNTKKTISKETTNTMNKLNSDQKSILLNSVLCYLNTNSFSKPLNRLISAANIKDDSWKACPLNLEDMFKHYLETSSSANGTKKEGDDHSPEEAAIEKKNKKCDDIGNVAAVAEEVELKTKKKTKKGSDSVEETEQVTEHTTKEKKDKKKNNKHNPEPLESNVDSKEEVKSKDKKKKSESSAKSGCTGEAAPDAEEKPKDKKKKKKKQNSVLDIKTEDKVETVLSEDKKEDKEDSSSKILSNGVTEVANKEGVEKEKKESKKRKRSESDDNDMGTPLTNGNHDVKGGESTGNKSRRKDNNDSAEPKTVTAFQRVKVEEVKFADERLQDNSYWAKDGADVGYGAKAQEVLGQVRGKDFRHEKTKKKRGSYRGGQIDLHSHSVKFNYDDDE